jgi:hypothetical protein
MVAQLLIVAAMKDIAPVLVDPRQLRVVHQPSAFHKSTCRLSGMGSVLFWEGQMELILIVVVLFLLSVAVDCGAVVVGGDDGSIGDAVGEEKRHDNNRNTGDGRCA